MSEHPDALETTGHVDHCGQPMKVLRNQFSWFRDEELRHTDMRCTVCGATGHLRIATPVGPPSEAAP